MDISERISKNILEKAVEVNKYLIELCEKNNFSLVDNPKRMKAKLLRKFLVIWFTKKLQIYLIDMLRNVTLSI